MAQKSIGLGRGLGSLIPQKPVAQPASSAAPAPSALQTVAAVMPAPAEEQGSRVLKVRVTEIIANTDQPRLTFGHQELEDLMNSIKEHGILQPLTVTPRASGGYELIAGERRLRAAKMVGLERVPVIVRETPNNEKLILALIENIQREDLNAMEEANGYRRLMDEFGLTQEDVSKKVGKARSTVANCVRLLDLPQEIKDAIAAGVIAAGSARAILALKDDESRLKFFRKLMGERFSVRQIERQTRKAAGGGRRDPAVLAAEEELRDKYGVKTEIKMRQGQGSVSFMFNSEEEYEALVDSLR